MEEVEKLPLHQSKWRQHGSHVPYAWHSPTATQWNEREPPCLGSYCELQGLTLSRYFSKHQWSCLSTALPTWQCHWCIRMTTTHQRSMHPTSTLISWQRHETPRHLSQRPTMKVQAWRQSTEHRSEARTTRIAQKSLRKKITQSHHRCSTLAMLFSNDFYLSISTLPMQFNRPRMHHQQFPEKKHVGRAIHWWWWCPPMPLQGRLMGRGLCFLLT